MNLKFEHLGINVDDPEAMAQWYVTHLGMQVVRKQEGGARTHFIVDASGSAILEIYNNPPDQVPAYDQQNPLLLHVAFLSSDPEADTKELVAAGAKLVEEIRPPDGSYIVMLRDPWGLALQLCRRATPFLKVNA